METWSILTNAEICLTEHAQSSVLNVKDILQRINSLFRKI